MWLQINPRSPLPMYQQIVHSVKEAVALRVLVPGERLPTVRELAAQFAINHNTVAKAYQELERNGVIETLRGKGTFVTSSEVVPHYQEKLAALQADMRTLIVTAHHLRIQPTDLQRMFSEAVEAWQRTVGEVPQ